MVERPIKKSERQAVTANDLDTPETQSSTNEGAEGSNTQSPQKPSTPPPLPVKDKKKGKGREQQKDEQSSKPPMNLALMRGPKPTKPKPPVTKAAEEVISDNASDEAEPEET